MTVDREKLREGLAEAFWNERYGSLPNASWDGAVRTAKAIPGGQAAEAVYATYRRADEFIAGPLAPILAQADSAERVAAAHAEDLIVPLARDLAREGGWPDPDVPWTENQVIIARGGAGAPVYQEYLDDARSLLGREALRSILSQNTRLSAEVERLRAALTRIKNEPSSRAKVSRWAFYDLQDIAAEALSTPGTDAPAAAREGSE